MYAVIKPTGPPPQTNTSVFTESVKERVSNSELGEGILRNVECYMATVLMRETQTCCVYVSSMVLYFGILGG